jgi:hypothetical protein
MTARALLNECAALGIVLEASKEGLRYRAPGRVVTPETLARLRQEKEGLLKLLKKRCPFCHAVGMRHERSNKSGFIYLDTLCVACGELVECYLPPVQESEGHAA